MTPSRFYLLCPFLVAFLIAATLAAQEPEPRTPSSAERPASSSPPGRAGDGWTKSLGLRSIGPAVMGGRITALAVSHQDPNMWWAATASGGLLKTTNDGLTFEHQFDRERVVSIGHVAVAPGDDRILWVGTGEANPRNSVSFGRGVYKSIDGGKTFQFMGLPDSFQVGRIVIHPNDPNVVYVGALGRLWGPNDERGLYKTVDGGVTWTKILHIDERTGVVDVQMHPRDPETLLVAAYERQRDDFDSNDPAKKIAPGSGLYRTEDGGASWSKVTRGLPTVNLGRIGLSFCSSHPDTVYALIESEWIGRVPTDAGFDGLATDDADAGARIVEIYPEGPAASAGLKVGDIIIAVDGERVHGRKAYEDVVAPRKSGTLAKLEISRERSSVFADLTLAAWPKAPEAADTGATSPAAGRRERTQQRSRIRPRGEQPFGTRLGGQVENMQSRQGDEGFQYGGVYRSDDGGRSFERVNSLNDRPMYFSLIRVDPVDPERVYVLCISAYQSSDGGKSFSSDFARGPHVDHHDLWIDPRDPRHMILGNDGGIYVTRDRSTSWDHLNHVAIGQFYHVAADARRDYRVYGGLQDNGTWGGPTRVANDRGPINEDWVRIGGGDGFVCRVDPEDPDLIYFTSQNGGLGRRHLISGPGRVTPPRSGESARIRFNWNTPYLLSHHNSKIYYAAGNRVFRSLSKGEAMRAISPEISRTEKGSATALGESPRDPDVLYVGTDDGALHVTRNGGLDWTDLRGGAAPPKPVDVAGAAISAQPGDGARPSDPSPEVRTPTEASASASPEGAERFLARLLERDANGDGKLQRDEVTDRFASTFDQLDRNSDGALDRSELEASMSRRRPTRGRRPDSAAAAPRSERPAPPTNAAEANGSAARPLSELVPAPLGVATLEPSRYVTGRLYLALDGHRQDDDRAHAFVSEDFGATFVSLTSGLPKDAGPVRVFREDPSRADILYLGTEFFFFISLDRGQTWTHVTEMPTVAIHEVAFARGVQEIVLATHGRSLWVGDVSVLRQATTEALAAAAHLFKPADAVLWMGEPSRGSTFRRFVGGNPVSGARVWFRLDKAPTTVSVRILGPGGILLRELDGRAEAGFQFVDWDLRAAARPREGEPVRGFTERPGRNRPGSVDLALVVDGEVVARTSLEVTYDPNRPAGGYATVAELEDAEAEFESEEPTEGLDPGR